MKALKSTSRWQVLRVTERLKDRFCSSAIASCIALISYFPLTMQNLHFRHPWRLKIVFLLGVTLRPGILLLSLLGSSIPKAYG